MADLKSRHKRSKANNPQATKTYIGKGRAKAQNTWLEMLNYQAYENVFQKLNLTNEEGRILLDYLKALALIGIEYLNNKEINDYKYD